MSEPVDVTGAKLAYRTARHGEFPDELVLKLRREADLRYGENPMQLAGVYCFDNSSLLPLGVGINLIKGGKGGWSATNYMDVTRALDVLKFFDNPSVAVMKHLIPSGFSTQHHGNSLREIYVNARDADARSAFGGIVVSNREIDEDTAEEILTSYVEGVAAPAFDQRAIEVFEKKKDLRVIQYFGHGNLPRFVGDSTEGIYDLKALPGGKVIVQNPYLTSIRSPSDLKLRPLVRYKEEADEPELSVSVDRDPTSQELEDLLTAWYVNFGVRSNGIVFVKDGTTIAIGSGQQERVGAVEQAIVKGYQKWMDREKIRYDPLQGVNAYNINNIALMELGPFKGAVCSSDAFFPFRDSIDTMARVGVSAVIQPGGSNRDYESIIAANEHKMAMPFTLERCFGHF